VIVDDPLEIRSASFLIVLSVWLASAGSVIHALLDSLARFDDLWGLGYSAANLRGAS
jgi:hypothetical protein